MTAVLPAIPDAQSVGLEQVAVLARQIETWADTTDDIAALEDTRARVAAIETYLRRQHETNAAEIARADRKLEIRIGQLLPAPAKGGDRGNQHTGGKSVHGHGGPGPALSRQRAAEFRKMAATADEPEVAEAVERGESRSDVLRRADRAIVKARAKAEDLEEGQANLTELASKLIPEGMNPAEDVRLREQRGAFRRLCNDIAGLPAPHEFINRHNGLIRSDHIDAAEAAYAWLDTFLLEWRAR